MPEATGRFFFEMQMHWCCLNALFAEMRPQQIARFQQQISSGVTGWRQRAGKNGRTG